VVHRWLLRQPRFHLRFTPTYASWLNLVERFFGVLTEKALRRGSHTSVAALRDAILAYVAAHNDKGKPFKWTKTADEILDKMRRFGLRTNRCMLSDQTFARNHRAKGLEMMRSPRRFPRDRLPSTRPS
jgi:transposase